MIGGHAQRQVDAVRDVQARALALVLDGAHDVAGVALGLELGGQLRIEHDEGARGKHIRDLALGGVHRGGHGEHVARQLQRSAIKLHAREAACAVLGDLPLARLLGLEQLARQLTERGSEGARVQAQLRAHPEPRVLRGAKHHGLHVHLGGNQVREGLQSRVVLGDDLQGGQRLAHAQLVRLAQRVGGRHDRPNLVHRGDEFWGIHGLVQDREVRQVHGLPSRQAPPDLLAQQRQQRRRQLHEGHESRV